MMIYEIPKITGWSELKGISFHNLIALKECLLKGMSNNLKLSVSLPPQLPSKEMLLGKLYHKFIELSYTSNSMADLNKAIEEEIIKLQVEVDKWPHLKSGAVSGWREVNSFAIHVMRNHSQNRGQSHVDLLGSEKRLISCDGILVGRPDLFTVIENTAKLREFKTYSLKNKDGTIRSDYEEQLLFYAVLLFDNYKIDVVQGSLASSRHETYERTIYKSEVEQYRFSAYNVISQANDNLKSTKDITQLSKPAKESCETCDKRIICSAFKKDQFNLNLERDVYILEGNIIDVLPDKTESLALIRIEANCSREIKEILIPKETACKLRPKGMYTFFDLGYRQGSLCWNERTRILSHA